MTNQEAIDIIKNAIAQVEWDYPMDYAAAFDMAVNALERQDDPDRVKVVRCWDCRYWEPPTKEEVEDGCTYGLCRATGAGTDVNDFCSSGERVEE